VNLILKQEIFPMTNLEGLPCYFWLASSRLTAPVQDDVPYTTQALRQDLLRVRNAWEESQTSRDRDAIYGYLTAVFNLVAWWTAEHRALERAHKALRLQRMCPFDDEEPFAAVIRCTADPAKVDKRTRSNDPAWGDVAVLAEHAIVGGPKEVLRYLARYTR
jgi:hypothetical protein